MAKFEKHAVKFLNSLIKNEDRKNLEMILKKLEADTLVLKQKSNQDLANIYLQILTKIFLKGVGYISTESKRVSKVMKEKMSDDKRATFKNKLKILSTVESFYKISKRHATQEQQDVGVPDN